jgi:hypothetical protein
LQENKCSPAFSVRLFPLLSKKLANNRVLFISVKGLIGEKTTEMKLKYFKIYLKKKKKKNFIQKKNILKKKKKNSNCLIAFP